MNLLRTTIPDVVIVEPIILTDERGWFMESFNEHRLHVELAKIGLPIPGAFVQDNHSASRKGVLRGLHYQLAPRAQGKLVRVVTGRAFDVVVDLRRTSERFKAWVGVELSSENRRQLWIPPGFAHGFLALEDNTQLEYKATAYYSKDLERSVNWSDKDIGIEWPMVEGPLTIAEKDRHAPFLASLCAV